VRNQIPQKKELNLQQPFPNVDCEYFEVKMEYFPFHIFTDQQPKPNPFGRSTKDD
jgi:hypothetical protein